MPRSRVTVFAAAVLLLLSSTLRAAPEPSRVVVSGPLRAWQRVTLTCEGPDSDESGAPNPFLDYRMSVTFSNGVRSQTVPGHFAADGDAAQTGATSGRVFRAHFLPDDSGVWRYAVFFRSGEGVALDESATAGSPAGCDGATGAFTVAPADPGARGLLRSVGQRYLRFAGNGEWFLKGGADSPENLLAFADFDGTPSRHRYEPHLRDFRPGDPSWRGGRGKALVGALNYLADRGMNTVYFLTMNAEGDGKDVWPWTAPAERKRYDVSKLDQWEIVFSHMDRRGILLHLVQQETENDHLLDGGALGVERKLYYRELVSRFGHHPALVWNLGEENTNSREQRLAFARYLRGLDAYEHPIVLHTQHTRKARERALRPLLGQPAIDGSSLQMGDVRETHDETLRWLTASAAAGRPWFVCLDELGPADRGVLPDADDPRHDEPRRYGLWANLMAGGSGVEWYLGSTEFLSSEGTRARRWWDLDTEDWRAHEAMWDQTRHALAFFREHLPFATMEPNDELAGHPEAWCLARPGEVYAVYLPNGGTTTLDLGGGTASYSVHWYDPRRGGALQNGSVTAVAGPGVRDLGSPPDRPREDWAILVLRR